MSFPSDHRTKHFISRQIVNYDTLAEDPLDNQQDFSARPDSDRSTSGSDSSSGYYTYNSLQSYTFGASQPPTTSSLLQSVDPLSAGPTGDDEAGLSRPADATPRPSVVADPDASPHLTCSHPAQCSGNSSSLGRGRQADSHPDSHPEGSSSSGLFFHSDSSVTHSRSQSRMTNSTDIQDSDDDHQRCSSPGRGSRHSGVGSSGTGTGESTAVELTDEDDDDFNYDDSEDGSEDDGTNPNIEVSSARYATSVITDLGWDHGSFQRAGSRSGSSRISIQDSERRGSLPMAIPGAATPSGLEASLFSNRNREDNIVSLRRPSRSLNDEFRRRYPEDGSQCSTDGINRPPAPISFPESGGDWRNLEERNKNKSPQPPVASSSSGGGDEFVETFNQRFGILGVSTFDDLDDILGPVTNLPQSYNASTRRPSAWKLPFFNVLRRHSTATESSADPDSFSTAVRSWGGDGYREQQREWTFKKEKADRGDAALPQLSGGKRHSTTDSLTPRGSIATDRIETVSLEDTDSISTEKEKPEKPAPSWKGMRIDGREIWHNQLVGRFEVNRRAITSDPLKSPQHRLVITHFRDGYTSSQVKYNGPLVTIHKHSRALAFSISRYYRTQPAMHPSRGDTSEGPPGGGDIIPASSRKASNTILLASRRVQMAYTSTNSTRKLRSHGLLDDKKGKRSKHRQESGGESRNRDRDGISGQEMPREGESATHDISEGQAYNDGDVHHSGVVASTSHRMLPSQTVSALPSPTYPASLPPSRSETDIGLRDCSSSRSSSRARRRRGPVRDPLEYDDDDDDGSTPPVRTTHSEAYGTMDVSVVERFRPRQDRQMLEVRSWKRFIPGRGQQPLQPPRPGQPYNPPWITLTPRNQQEQRERAVHDLNSSFKDCGLLPSPNKQAKPKKPASATGSSDLFSSLLPDSLFMLLPLWPSESAASMEGFQKPRIPLEKRQYLMVYYKPFTADGDRSKEEGRTNKRSRSSPTSSFEMQSKRDDQSPVLPSPFTLGARRTTYSELQNSGVRVPGEGLSVNGPLDTAFGTMPKPLPEPLDGKNDGLLGTCRSRDSGIQFDPECMVKFELGVRTSEPCAQPMPEEYQAPESDVELTPIGRAVMEMAWLGAMALTSFGPGV